ncbi:MAG: phosphoribosyltransferase family protein [Candidatus Woesearchaeota archaeon]
MKTAKERSLSKGKEKFNLTWYSYLYYIKLLINNIKRSKINFKYVYGIPRGGLIPATIISHEFNLILVPSIDKIMKNGGYRSHLLIVDDICDTGETIKNLIDCKNYKKGNNFFVATLFKHINSTINPDFYAKETDKWIVFPYEKE